MYMTSAAARLLLLAAIVLTGCARTRQVARDAAVTTFRVIDAPANYVRRKLDEQEAEASTTTTTTTTTDAAVGTSDVVTPGRPVAPQRQVTTRPQPNPGTVPPGPTPRPRRETATAPTSTPAPPQTEFPTARPVPGKPGFVYSIAPDGGIVDVTGYKSGDKAKDPYTKQIFIVP
jgi:hypothetical protein